MNHWPRLFERVKKRLTGVGQDRILPHIFVFILCFCLWQPPAKAQGTSLPSLKLEQLEQLLAIGWDDTVLARELLKRGIAFRADAKALERLEKKKLGAQTRAALNELEQRAAFAELQKENQPQARANLAQQFLQRHPQSAFAADVRGFWRTAEVELFDAAQHAYLTAPDLAKLNALFTRADELRQRDANATLALHLTTRLAVAAGRGVFNNFYDDLARSRQLAETAFRQLDANVPPAGVNPESFQRLRSENLMPLAQLLAFYHLRQSQPDTAAALRLLERAAAADAVTAKDPVTYWLRAWANREQAQRLRTDYAALPPTARASEVGQALCKQFAALSARLVEDYAKVVELGGAASSRVLREEAGALAKTQAATANPCVQPAAPPPAQRARRVGKEIQRTLFIRSKTVYLRPPQLETVLLKDPEFQALGWRVIRNEKEADVVAEVTLPFLTWQWTVELTHRPTSALLGTVQVRETVASTALPKLAPQIIALLKQAKF
jgi:hypothetical protein